MEELGKLDFKINVIPNGLSNGLEKYVSFNINNKLIFIDSLQFLNFSLYILVKILGKVDFQYLSQKFDSNELVKQNEFYPYMYMSGFEKFKEKLLSKKIVIVRWRVKKNLLKSMIMFLNFEDSNKYSSNS